MSMQATVRATGNDERTMLARATVSLVNPINERSTKFFVRFMAALHESRRREAARLLRRYRHLNNDLNN